MNTITIIGLLIIGATMTLLTQHTQQNNDSLSLITFITGGLFIALALNIIINNEEDN